LVRRFGVLGLVALALLSAAGYVFTHWDTVNKWPGVASVVTYLLREPVPPADPNRFTILVAHLENDTNREHERQIIHAMVDFKEIKVLQLDRTITLEGSDLEKQEKLGHESAQKYLKESGASVLIWGIVLSRNGKTGPILYWTASQGSEVKSKLYDATSAESSFRLPPVFWSDLTYILQLLIASHDAEFRAKEGSYVADRLSPFIARVRSLLDASPNRPGWDSDARGSTRMVLGYALDVLGEQSGRKEPLEEAVAVYKAALEERTRERVPLKWASTQNNLGTALVRLGERESGTQRLEEAVAVYKAALEERTRERVPLKWASTQNNLGTALTALGERESGTQRLKEAVAAYKTALEERTRERVPLDWAMTQNNLGAALTALGEQSGRKEPLEEAVAVYKAALEERTRERVPLDWAMTQNNLGTALTALGERESGTQRLEEAVAAYKTSIEVFESGQAAYQVKITEANLQKAEALLRERRN
jgi:tetratricopeptide (TPR) repeat protein